MAFDLASYIGGMIIGVIVLTIIRYFSEKKDTKKEQFANHKEGEDGS